MPEYISVKTNYKCLNRDIYVVHILLKKHLSVGRRLEETRDEHQKSLDEVRGASGTKGECWRILADARGASHLNRTYI